MSTPPKPGGPTRQPWVAEAYPTHFVVRGGEDGRTTVAFVPISFPLRPGQDASDDPEARANTALVINAPSMAEHLQFTAEWLDVLFGMVHGELDDSHHRQILELLQHNQTILRAIGIEPHMHFDDGR